MLLCGSLYALEEPAVRIHGSSGVVDINDIVNTSVRPLSGTDIKRINAAVTARYHRAGYTAFYIENAIVSPDGTVDLYFNESLVEKVILPGDSRRSDAIAAMIFKAGAPFNEITLSENISAVKRKYNIRKITVDTVRSENGGIILDVNVKGFGFGFGTDLVYGPLHGLVPGVSFSMFHGGYAALMSASSSFMQRRVCYSSGRVEVAPDTEASGAGFNMSAAYSDKKNYLYAGRTLFTQKSSDAAMGLFYRKGAFGMKFNLAGSINSLEEYPGISGGVSFAGLAINLKYNDAPMRIDHNDRIFCEAALLSGRNYIEDRYSFKSTLRYDVNLPMADRFFMSFNGSTMFTSDHERFLQFYIFDKDFPCRERDYSHARFKNVAGTDIVFEIFRGTIFLSSGVRWGYYRGESTHSILAPSFRAIYSTSAARVVFNYMYDAGLSAGKGVFTFSAAASYL